MKDLKAASLTHQNDEFLNSLLKSSFDSNLRDESLDIDLSACVAIYNEPHQLNCGGLSSEFWRALDETAQSGLPDSVSIPTPTKQPPSIKLEKKDREDKEQECNGHETTKKVRKKKEKEQPTKNNNNSSNLLLITTATSSIKKSDLENNENSSHKTTNTSSKVPNNITITKVETPFAEIFNLDNLESAGIRFKYKCDRCDEIMDSLESLTKHETVHKHLSVNKKHSSSKALSKSKDTWQKCPDCGKSLKSGSMWMHRKIHSDNKPYGCDICGQKFVQKINLTNHAKVHSGVKPFACPECQKTFPEKSHLLRHQKYHTSTRPFRCDKCGKMYKTERCLKVHNLVHLEQRPFVCQVCSKSFISNSKLKQHLNIHTGERPYKCNYCSRDFTNFPNWLKHTRRRHKVDHKTGELLEKIPSYCSKQKQQTKSDTNSITKPKRKTAKRKEEEISKVKPQQDKIKVSTLPPQLLLFPKTKLELNIKKEIIETQIPHPPSTILPPSTNEKSFPSVNPCKKIEIKKEVVDFDEFHGLSLNSFEEYLMNQTLEIEEANELKRKFFVKLLYNLI
ncbi:wdn family protein [Megaselia abdita]